MPNFLADFGQAILANGYEVVPIRPGQKFPDFDTWRTDSITSKLVASWVAGKFKKYGLGVRTDRTPMIDIDCMDADASRRFAEWCQDNIGFAPVRVGQPPKRGLIYQTLKPFSKVMSKVFLDSHGRKAQLEILGEGQQFVAEHIHPDTGKPYLWLDGENLRNMRRSDLAVITEEKARKAVAEFERMAGELGWKVKPRSGLNGHGRALAVIDDPFDIAYEPLPDIDDDKLAEMVATIPNEDREYDDWVSFLMAIHHQTGGSEEGREIALQWSEESPKHIKSEFDKTWRSFGKPVEGRNPVTARLIVKQYREIKVEEKSLEIDDIIDRIEHVGDVKELRSIARECTKIDADPMDKSRIVSAIRDAFKRITTKTLSLGEARSMVRYIRDAGNLPPWAAPWVYLSQPERFFHVETKEMVTTKSFSLMNAGNVMKGDDAAHYAIEALKLPVKHNAIYLPTQPTEFRMDGKEYLNTYSDEGVPEVPDRLTRENLEHLELVKTHFSKLIGDQRELNLLLSWLAYIVQTRDRVNWAVVMQGATGIGKTFIGDMMGRLVGARNVSPITPDVALKTAHNTWACGKLLAYVEEIRIAGQNRYEVLDKFKTAVTNEMLDINPKTLPMYTTPNTQSYVFMTNHRDALPIDNGDRRYFIIVSPLQKGEERLAAGMNETYFDRLYEAINLSAGAIRGWLLSYELHEEFKPKGRAPMSEGREKMIAATKSDDIELLEDLIEQGSNAKINADFVIASAFAQAYFDDTEVKISPTSLRIGLQRAGYTFIGRVRIEGHRERIWVSDEKIWGKSSDIWRHKIERILAEADSL